MSSWIGQMRETPPRAGRRVDEFQQENFWKKRVGLTQLGRVVNSECQVFGRGNAFGENLFFTERMRLFKRENRPVL